ncbi:MAG TPA: hypothetical protein VFQ45_02985 [Longimicrobium sp.]|nr:hypothetical protein [Longimicrobium sp.]
MSHPDAGTHPPEFVRLCDDAIAKLEALKAASPFARGPLIPPIHERLAEIAAAVAELDLRAPGFADEQAALTDAASKLQAIEMDRGGPHVARFVDRIVADLRRLAAG